jgi:hypothetical protein
MEDGMPRYSGVTFSVQPVERDGVVSGYVISGFLTEEQLKALRAIVDSPDYERSKRWRGEFQEMAKAIIEGVDKGLETARG